MAALGVRRRLPLAAHRHRHRLAVDNVPVPKQGYRAPELEVRLGRLKDLRIYSVFSKMTEVAVELFAEEVEEEQGADVRPVLEAVFRELKRVNRDKESPLLLVYFPMRKDSSPNSTTEQWLEYVAAEADRQGIAFLDVVSPMREAEGPWNDRFRVEDGHFSEAGNRFAAELIHEKLRELDTVPGENSSGR